MASLATDRYCNAQLNCIFKLSYMELGNIIVKFCEIVGAFPGPLVCVLVWLID